MLCIKLTIQNSTWAVFTCGDMKNWQNITAKQTAVLFISTVNHSYNPLLFPPLSLYIDRGTSPHYKEHHTRGTISTAFRIRKLIQAGPVNRKKTKKKQQKVNREMCTSSFSPSGLSFRCGMQQQHGYQRICQH